MNEKMYRRIPSRVILSILGCYACALVYAHRGNLSVAIVSMVKSRNFTSHSNSGICISNVSSNESTYERYERSGQYEWSESLQGLILGGAYYPCVITPIIAGRIAERFGAKLIIAITVFTPAVLSALIPIAAQTHVGLVITLCVLIGACNGCVYTSILSLYANWFPKQERASAVAACAFGFNIGLVIIFPLSGYLCDYGFGGWWEGRGSNWPSVFYVTALLHVPWLFAWCIFAADSPMHSRRISKTELEYIKSNCDTYGTPKKSSTAPWLSIITSPVVFASIVSKISAGFGYFLLLNKMPAYLNDVFGISLVNNGLYNCIVNLAAAISMLIGGPLSDYIRKKNLMTITRLRKNFQILAFLGPAICISIIPSVGCNSTAVITLLTLAMFTFGFMTGGEWPIISEYAPDFAGTVFGFANGFGFSTAFISPLFVGIFLNDNPGDRERWNIVFYITVGIYIFGLIIFELFTSAEPQPWGVIPKETEEIPNKKGEINLNLDLEFDTINSNNTYNTFKKE